MNVSYRYWDKARNCGDAVTAYILRDVLGHTPVTVPRDRPHLLATGSIFFLANPASVIWGSGVLHPGDRPKALDPSRIRAVRGHRTLEVLRRWYPGMPDVPLGDPGVLVSRLPGLLGAEPRYRAALVPHRRSTDRAAQQPLPEDVCLVDMRDATLRPLERIAQAEVVISQSLHGLVFAAALGKPYVWTSDDTSEDWTFKFADWFSTTHDPQAVPLATDTPLPELIAAAQHRPFREDPDALLRAFPLDDVGTEAATPVIDFETCRRAEMVVIRADCLRALHAGNDSAELQPRQARRAMADIWRRVVAALPGWAEIPYVLVCPPGARFDGFEPGLVARWLDRNKRLEAVALLPSGRVGAFAADPRFSTDRIAATRELTPDPDMGLILRPSANPLPGTNVGTLRMRLAGERAAA